MIESTCGGIEGRRHFFHYQCSGHGTFSTVQFDLGGFGYGLVLCPGCMTLYVVRCIVVRCTINEA